MGKKLTVVLTGILVCMALVGCAADKSNRYEGAGMSFKYGPGWSIFYREADEDNHVIELYSEEGAGLSVVSCQRDISSVEEIYQGMISADQLLGQVSGMAAVNNMSEEKGTASYAHRTKTNFAGDYWTLFFGKNLGDGQVMLAAATIYIIEEEEADQCRKEIEEIIASLKFSDKTDTGEITKAMVEPDIQTNVLVNYLSGEERSYDYMEGSQAASAEPVSLEGFEYVEAVTLTDAITNQEVEVCIPIGSDSYDGGGFYYGHGIQFSLTLAGDWLYSSPEEELSRWMQSYTSDVNEHPSRYRNMVIDDAVTVEEGLCCYQHMSVEELDTMENATTNHTLVYVGTAPNGIGYIVCLSVTGRDTDKETNQVLEELGNCYHLDLSGYGNAEEDLTNAGERVNPAQDIYTPKTGDPEIREADGYIYMGVTEISDYEDHIYEVMIPMGQNTKNYGNSLYANMHGVNMTIGTSSLYGSTSLIESVQETIQYRYDFMAENSRDYKDLSIGEPEVTTQGEGVYCSTSAGEHISYDEQVFPYHQVYYELRLQGNNVLTMTLTLDEHDYDAFTNILLGEIEEAYRMDLSEFYYDK